MEMVYMAERKPVAAFDWEKSLALKGIAIIMMLTHHCFMDSTLYPDGKVSFFLLSAQRVTKLALVCRICVSIYAFITGYGLFKSYASKREDGTATSWCARRYVKSFSGYWFAWVIAAIVLQVIRGETVRTLFSDGAFRGIINSVIDFLGIWRLFDAPRLIPNTWYMSAALVFILLTPLVWRLKDDLWLLMAGIVVLPRVIRGIGADAYVGDVSVYPYLAVYLMGAIFARYSLFERWTAIASGKPWTKAYKFAVMLWLLTLGYKTYLNVPLKVYWEYSLCIFPVAFIMFSVEFILIIPGLRELLKLLGKHSLNIWLVHEFFRTYAYESRHFLAVVLVLLGISLGVSFLLEGIKKVIRYEKIVNWLELKAG